MRVAFVSTSSLDYPSALGRWFPLAKEMVRLGHTVHFITLHHDYRSGMSRPQQQAGVWVHYVGQMHVRGWGDARRPLAGAALLRVALAATVALGRRARQVEVDAYHICKPQPMNGLAGWLAARRTGRPCYLDCDDYEAGANRFTGWGQQALVRWFEDTLPRRMAAVSVNTRFLADRVGRLGVAAGRIVHVPNGVERARFAGLDRGAGRRLRAEYGLQGKPTILYLGTLSLAGHPLGLLLDALTRLVALVPQAHLVLVGGGEDRPALERRVQELRLPDHVTFVGAVPPAEVPPYILLGDVAVDPVLDDAVARARSPLKVLESMACGVPVVTGDVGDRREMLADGQAGLLVVPGDAQALAEGLAALLEDPARRQQMAAAGREQVERYWWDRLVHPFLGLYGPGTAGVGAGVPAGIPDGP
jgi:glycosyltransferase involved in cell wall biosynthesis